MRIGFFGGTFDPPHLGHLAVAQAALRTYALDRILIAPTGHQPLKPHSPIASFADRLAMVELLCREANGLQASAIDRPQPDGAPNFTIDTLARLRAGLDSNGSPDASPDVSLFMIVGADAFLDLRRWREPDKLLEAAEWIVVSRPGAALDLAPLKLTATQRARVYLLDTVHVPVSATEVRAQLQAHHDVSGLLPPEVSAYIRAHHLYG
ncbi:MAG TPA: nicotinate (nicotinamide) nucleotide adenylyltransferase [Acidobacteriaceae bacterium]